MEKEEEEELQPILFMENAGTTTPPNFDLKPNVIYLYRDNTIILLVIQTFYLFDNKK